MITEYEYNIKNDTHFSFFVANCDNVDLSSCNSNIDMSININLNANIFKLTQSNYNMGILLNNYNRFQNRIKTDCVSSQVDIITDTLDIPIFNPNEEEIYVVRINHNHHTITKKYCFIFIDIAKFYFDDGTSQLNKLFFYALDGSSDMDETFIVSNVTPYYYLRKDPNNECIIELINCISRHTSNKLHYISSDNDYYANINICEHDELLDYMKRINFVLVGNIGSNDKRPKIFDICNSMDLDGNVYFTFESVPQIKPTIKSKSISSGYVGFNIGTSYNHTFVGLQCYEKQKHIVDTMVRIVYNNMTKPINNSDLVTLLYYKSYADKHNCYNKLLNLTATYGNLKLIMICDILTKLNQEIAMIIVSQKSVTIFP